MTSAKQHNEKLAVLRKQAERLARRVPCEPGVYCDFDIWAGSHYAKVFFYAVIRDDICSTELRATGGSDVDAVRGLIRKLRSKLRKRAAADMKLLARR